jgi:Putative Ig domain/Abnormal spindle-like microcephaly-assoc'd, ASPM-SPD-2-Hydin
VKRLSPPIRCLILISFLLACLRMQAQDFVNCNSGVVCALPTLLTFAQTNGTSALQNVTVYNGLTTNVTIDSVSSNLSQFTVTGATPKTLTPGQFETFQVQFKPDSAKTFTGKVTFTMTGTKNQSVNLSGTGWNANAVPSLNTTSVDFGNQALGTNGPSQSVKITNTGSAAVKLTGVTVTSPFSQTGWTTSTTIAAGGSLTLKVSYTPTKLAANAGMIYLTYDVAASQGVSLWGTGVSATALGVNSFGNLAAATQGALYKANLNAAGGKSPYTWALASGSTLPSGLSLSSAGVISGTVSSTATLKQYSFSATVTDAASATYTRAFTLTVSKPTGASCKNTVFNGSDGTPLTPLLDLGTGLYKGAESGGLYANGSNADDPSHRAFGQGAAGQIQPLDSNGNPDPNGKYVLLGVGLSITQQSWAQFVPMAMADPAKNPNLVVVNGATGGATATNLININNDAFWEVMTNAYIPNAGVTAKQVQAVFFMDLDGGPSGTFPGDMKTLQSQFETVMRNLLTEFPNLKIAYLSSVYYMGYSNGLSQKLDPEPWAYEAGFAVKNVIQDQINGVGNLNYDPSHGTVTAPWMSWGPYLWANGMNARGDGLVWSCQDVQPDGTHPAVPGGRIKVASILLNFFKTDDTASPWFLSPSARN